MLDIKALQKTLEAKYCYHEGEVIVLGGVEHCADCGAILGSVKDLYRIWRRCLEQLGLKPKGHDFGKKVKK